jgi:sulfur carrier protein ThiS
MAGLVFCAQNPLSPVTTSLTYPVENPITIRQWLDDQGITEFGIPTICYYNGTPTLRAQWLTTVIYDDDRVVFMPILQGGGGSNPLRAILTIALMVAAPFLGGLAAGMLGITSTIGVSLVTAGVMMAGTALINAVVPAPKPQLSNANAESPTYSLTAQGNQARLEAPIPVIYGRHLIYPDFLCLPFVEYKNNKQYLYQAFMIGQGEYEMGKLCVEDSPASSFAEFQATRLYNNAYTACVGVNAIPASADLAYYHRITSTEVSGQELLGTNETGAGWIGPFVINSADTEISAIEWDIIAPRGLGYTNDNGSYAARTATFELQYQAIDDAGESAADWTYTEPYIDALLNAAEPKPIRKTYKINVPPGRYQVRMKRTNVKDTNARAFDEIRWAGLKGRSVLKSQTAFNNKTMLLTCMTATDALSAQQSRKINAIVTRKLPYYTLINGVPTLQPATVTRSIVWAMLDILTASYGAKQNAADIIDLKSLIRLDAKLKNIAYYCDIVIDNVTTVWDALKLVARLARAVPVLELGKVRIVRDERRIVPVALFGPGNIRKKSLSIDYIMPSEDTADTVKVEYFDGQKWKQKYATARLADSGRQNVANVQLLGCTQAAQAQTEGLYMAANNRYRREFVTFSTEMDGFIPRYGDLIKVVHDMASWGQHAEVISYNASTQQITVHPPLEWATNTQHMIAFRTKTGAITNAVRCRLIASNTTTDDIYLETVPFRDFMSAGESEPTYVAFGVVDQWAENCIVLSIKPKSLDEVEIFAVVDDERVYING